MSVDRSKILTALARLELPSGGDLVSNDFIRAVTIDGKSVKRLSGSAAKKKCEELGFKIGSTEFPKCLRILTQ